MSFETQFGSIIDQELKGRIPLLLQYRLGFQVLHKTDDETRAVGVYGFLIKNIWAFMPLFYIKGRVCGFELLWLKAQDLFVPAKDPMILALRDKGTDMLGHVEGSKEDEQRDITYSPDEVKLENYDTPGTGVLDKMSFDTNSMVTRADVEKMFRVRRGNPQTFAEKLASLGPRATSAFAQTFTTSPDFANAVLRFYSPDDLHGLTQQLAQAFHKQAAESPNDKVKFITSMDAPEAQILSSKDKTTLIQEGSFVQDARTETTQVFHGELNKTHLQNPTRSGLYDVLLRDGSYQQFLLVLLSGVRTSHRGPSMTYDLPQSDRSVALIPFDDPTQYFLRNVSEVYARPLFDTQAALNKKFGNSATRANLLAERPKKRKQPKDPNEKQAEPAVVGEGTWYSKDVLLVQDPDRATEVSVRRPDDTGELSVEVRRPLPKTGAKEFDAVRLEFTGDDGEKRQQNAKLSQHQGTLYVPSSARMFVKYTYDDERKLSLGDLSTVQSMLVKNAGLRPLHIDTRTGMVVLKISGQTSEPLLKEAAERALILNLGVHAPQARAMIKETIRLPERERGFLVKLAAGYDSADESNFRPFVNRPPIRQESTEEMTQVVGGRPLLPPEVVRKASNAANQGVTEVFEADMVKALLDVADVSELKGDLVTGIVQGMDKKGRMLFLFYWHNDAFEEKYSEAELRQLEDLLRQVFVKDGELVLMLREKLGGVGGGRSLFDTIPND